MLNRVGVAARMPTSALSALRRYKVHFSLSNHIRSRGLCFTDSNHSSVASCRTFRTTSIRYASEAEKNSQPDLEQIKKDMFSMQTGIPSKKVHS